MKAEEIIISKQDMKKVLIRIAHEILEKHKGVKNLALIGIQTRGDFLAKRLEQIIKNIEGTSLPVGDMDINLYRDDWTKISQQPIVKPSNITFNIDDKKIILVDDVLFTGRTTRSAMDALMDFGRPAQIELAVLVDRGHRELPIQADYKGIFINTQINDIVNVCLEEHDNVDKIFIAQD